MKLWKLLFQRAAKGPLDGAMYRVTSTLYSADAARSAEIREFSGGDVYLLESERSEGATFKPRHDGRLVGPFVSPEAAEQFIAATSWFKGVE